MSSTSYLLALLYSVQLERDTIRLARNIPTVVLQVLGIYSCTIGIAVADKASDAFALGGTEGREV